MIMDEVQTGKTSFEHQPPWPFCGNTHRSPGFGATGKFWAHEHFNLQPPPDMVTFSKRAQTAGYYFGDDKLVPDQAYRQFNTYASYPFPAAFDVC